MKHPTIKSVWFVVAVDGGPDWVVVFKTTDEPNRWRVTATEQLPKAGTGYHVEFFKSYRGRIGQGFAVQLVKQALKEKAEDNS